MRAVRERVAFQILAAREEHGPTRGPRAGTADTEVRPVHRQTSDCHMGTILHIVVAGQGGRF